MAPRKGEARQPRVGRKPRVERQAQAKPERIKTPRWLLQLCSC